MQDLRTNLTRTLLVLRQRVCTTFLRLGLSRSLDGKPAHKVDTRPVFKMFSGGARCRGLFCGRPRLCVLDSGRLESLWCALQFDLGGISESLRSKLCKGQECVSVGILHKCLYMEAYSSSSRLASARTGPSKKLQCRHFAREARGTVL